MSLEPTAGASAQVFVRGSLLYTEVSFLTAYEK